MKIRRDLRSSIHGGGKRREGGAVSQEGSRRRLHTQMPFFFFFSSYSLTTLNFFLFFFFFLFSQYLDIFSRLLFFQLEEEGIYLILAISTTDFWGVILKIIGEK